jgi:hypothetical protein
VVRRALLFVIAFAAGYRAAYLAVDAAGRAALRLPWRDSPRMLLGEATSVVRGRLSGPVRERVSEVRAAVGEGREAIRRREQDLPAETNP